MVALNAGWVRVRRGHARLHVELSRPLTAAQMRALLEAADGQGEVDVEVREPGSQYGVRFDVTVAGNRVTLGRALREASTAAA